MRLKNKVAIITAAGSGSGRMGSLLFAREGAKVIVGDIKVYNYVLYVIRNARPGDLPPARAGPVAAPPFQAALSIPMIIPM